jgi:hypothetical protein
MAAAPALRCWRHAPCYAPLRRRALRVAAVVGTLAFLTNELEVVLSGRVTALVVLTSVLMYVVPFLIWTYVVLEFNRIHTGRSTPGRTPPARPGATA